MNAYPETLLPDVRSQLAEAESLLKLARALGCEMEDLLEPQGKEG